MKKILDMLFIKNEKLDRELFRALFYSFDNDCFAGFDKDIILKHQIYDSYKILKERITKIAENHNEYKYFIEVGNQRLFVRIISDYEDMVYDILIYSILDEALYKKYDRIFFPNILIIPNELENMNKTIILKDDNHIKLIKNEGLFLKYLGYEDWDFKNKCDNNLEMATKSNILVLFNNKDFSGKFIFKKNGGELIELFISFKYLNNFYYIDNVK